MLAFGRCESSVLGLSNVHPTSATHGCWVIGNLRVYDNGIGKAYFMLMRVLSATLRFGFSNRFAHVRILNRPGDVSVFRHRFHLAAFPVDCHSLSIELFLSDPKTWDLFDMSVFWVQVCHSHGIIVFVSCFPEVDTLNFVSQLLVYNHCDFVAVPVCLLTASLECSAISRVGRSGGNCVSLICSRISSSSSYLCLCLIYSQLLFETLLKTRKLEF